MWLLALSALILWIYLVLLRGMFWLSRPVLDQPSTLPTASVAVVVPARDEAEHIATSIGSLLHQTYAGPLHVILVDDNSQDGTAQIARALPGANALTIVNGAPLPAGWSGKMWAVHQGLAHPLAQQSDYVLLTDADIEHAPEHVSQLVAKAESCNLDLVSEMVHLRCTSLPERALIPAFIYFFQMLYPFAWVNDARKDVSGAAGGTMLIRRPMLDRINGVHSVRHHLIDDCALAHQIHRAGGSIWLGHAERAESRRIYAHWRDIWRMIARTAYVQLNHSPLALFGCIASMLLVYVAPVYCALITHGGAQYLGLAAWALMAFTMQPTLRRYRVSPLWGFLLPLIALFYLAATIASAIEHHRGRGGAWKARVYPQS